MPITTNATASDPFARLQVHHNWICKKYSGSESYNDVLCGYYTHFHVISDLINAARDTDHTAEQDEFLDYCTCLLHEAEDRKHEELRNR